MSSPKNKYAALEDLLRSMFDETELRAFIYRLPEADRLVASLPGVTASLLKVVFEVINLLNRHGVIDSDFFEALAAVRPRMRGEIAEVASVWGFPLPVSVSVVASQADGLTCEPIGAVPAKETPTVKPSPPKSPEGWDVFVSYAHEDQDWVRLLVENLHELGLNVFYDEWEIGYGDTVSLRLSDGLRRSRNGVLVVSPTAVSRPWVLEEYASLLEGAVQRGQRLIPVLYRDAEMPAMLSTRRWIDLRDKTGGAYLAEVARLAATLKGERPKRPKRGQGLRAPGSSVVVPTSSVEPTSRPTLAQRPTPAERPMQTTSSPEPTSTSAEVVKATQGRPVEMTPRRELPRPEAYRWLHLSDLHIGCRGQDEWIQMVDDFERSLDEWLPRVGVPDLVLLTGDLTNRGLREEFDRLDVFLDRLLTRIERHSGGARPLVIPVPGNHDLQRPSEDDLLDNYAAYERYIVTDDRMGQRLHNRLWGTEKGTESAERVGQLFAEYIGWLERSIVSRLTSRASEVKLHTSFFPGDLSAVVELPGCGFPLAVVGLNSSWLQIQGGNHERKLAMPLAQFHAALPGDSPLDLFHKDRVHRSLLLMHHPPTWLAERFEREFLRGIYRPERFAICLHGHMHEPTSERRAVAGGEDRLFFQAPSLFGLEHYGTSKESRLFGYSFGELREDGQVRAWPLDRAVKGDGVSEFVPDHHRWRWLDTPADESVEYRQHVLLRRGDDRLWRSHEPASDVERKAKPFDGSIESFLSRDACDRYRAWLDDRYGWVDLTALTCGASEGGDVVRLVDVFVPQEVEILWQKEATDERVQIDEEGGRPRMDITTLLDAERPRLLIVSGDPGAGKSALATWICVRSDARQEGAPLPVLIDLSKLAAAGDGSMVDLYGAQLRAAEVEALDGAEVASLAGEGRILWVFDGLAGRGRSHWPEASVRDTARPC